ncbi:MAG: hypothetical protein KAT65_20530 [Methanophagales archaeon]|nr:hypothetical protein [Methanophagales archaeon]
MNIKGEYRDVLSRNGTVIVDTRWKSNEIVDDYGRFLAALMKKAFEQKVGIEYIAVGSGSDNDCAVFKAKVEKFFDEWYNTGKTGHLKGDNYWVWAKKIDVDNIIYLDDEGKEVRDPDIFTNRLKIDVKFKKEEPSEDTLVFKEFALRGIDKKDKKDDKSNTEKLFFINYVDHGRITKDKSTELTRSIKLTFPIEEKEVVS